MSSDLPILQLGGCWLHLYKEKSRKKVHRFHSNHSQKKQVAIPNQISMQRPSLWDWQLEYICSVHLAQIQELMFCVLKMEHSKLQLTDGLCYKISCSSHSHHILGSHWHTVIAWGRIWGWLKGVTTPPSCAPGNVHTLSNHNRPSVETDLVLCDVSSWAWACWPWVHWILKGDTKVKALLCYDWLIVGKKAQFYSGKSFFLINSVIL